MDSISIRGARIMFDPELQYRPWPTDIQSFLNYGGTFFQILGHDIEDFVRIHEDLANDPSRQHIYWYETRCKKCFHKLGYCFETFHRQHFIKLENEHYEDVMSAYQKEINNKFVCVGKLRWLK